MKCAHCPTPADSPCRTGVFCDWARGGDPVHLAHIAAVALKDAGRPVPIPAARPCLAPPPAPTLPLAGDVLESALKRLGAEKLTAWWEARTGKPCGCASRRDAINRADAALRRWLAR